MGKLLKNDHDFDHYNVQDGNVLHLIANLEERPAPLEEENIQTEGPNQDNYEEEEAVFNERGEQEILAGIFRTLSDTSLNRRNYRRRMLQRRLAGFNIDSKESLEVIRQNLLTISQLDRDRVKNHHQVKPISQIKGFNFSERKLEIGQWIDVKDTIEQWLEAEVIDVNDNQVYVHYNGWGRRWDEWIDMNSPRIAAFRTHTVQSPYSMFMSPNPAHSLDGDHTNVPEVSNKIEDIIGKAKDNNYKLSDMLDQLVQSMKKREELIRKKPKEKSERSPITMRIKKRKVFKQPKIKRRKTVKKGLGSSEKYNMEKEDRIETQSNFSLKIRENNLSNFRDKDDCHSMKSLKLKKSTEADTEKDKDNDSMSSKSFKSQMSSNLNFNFPDYISEERSIDDEEYERDILQERKAHEIEVKKANQELKEKCSQLAPIMERMGRMMVDLAPHVAMMGSNLFQPCTNTVSGVSTHTIDGSQISQNVMNDPIQRLLYPQNNIPSSLGRRTISGFTNLVGNSNPNLNMNDLSSRGRTLDFEIPVMLNPGELLSVTPRHDNLVGNGNVHLHLNAQVHLPERDANEYLASENPSIRPEMRDMGAQTDLYQPERRISGFTRSITSPKNPENTQSPLLKSLTKNPSDIRNFAYPQNSPFTQSRLNNGLQSLPSFGGLRHTTSEGPKDTELSEIPSVKKYNKRGGMSIMRDEDLNRELLDNSLHGTIEERDENEEPEMQDISFRDLDFGVDIIENEEINENDEFNLEDDELGEVFLGKTYSEKKEATGNKSVDDNNLNIFNDLPKSENLGSDENSKKIDEDLSSNFSFENKEKLLKDSDKNLVKGKSGSSMKSDLR